LRNALERAGEAGRPVGSGCRVERRRCDAGIPRPGSVAPSKQGPVDPPAQQYGCLMAPQALIKISQSWSIVQGVTNRSLFLGTRPTPVRNHSSDASGSNARQPWWLRSRRLARASPEWRSSIETQRLGADGGARRTRSSASCLRPPRLPAPGRVSLLPTSTLRVASMALVETQQLRMLERLRRAGTHPVTLGELRTAGIDFPAVVLSELEIHGHAVDRVYTHGRLIGVRLHQTNAPDTPVSQWRQRWHWPSR
jgi:hypothetical protein